MERPNLAARGERGAGEALGRSRWQRLRSGRSLVVVPAIVAAGWALLVAAFASASQLVGPEQDRGSWGDVVGAVAGNFVMAFVLTVVVSAIVRGTRGTGADPHQANGGVEPAGAIGRGRAASAPGHHSEPRRRLMRRVLVGGVVGAVPGMLIALVPLVLAGLGVITGDQSQIGFVGLPLLVVGIVVGTLTAAADSGCAGAVLLGITAGFLAGVSVSAAMTAVGVGLPGSPVLATPIGMIAGAALSVYLCGRHTPRTATQSGGRPRTSG
jgi:hypothetical protein